MQKFINSQLSERRRKAARNLIDNLTYVTTDELFYYVENLIKDLYSTNDDDIYFIIVDDNNHSMYYMMIIAVYFIRILGYKDPKIIRERNRSNFSYRNESILASLIFDRKPTIVYLDDCAYSGLQSSRCIELYSKYNINLIMLFCVITESALDLYSQISKPHFDYNLNMIEPINLDFLTLKYTRKVESIKNKIKDFEDYVDIMYYFSPNVTNTCIYFDHKIASENSTFRDVLLNGTIIEKLPKYDYNEYSSIFWLFPIEEYANKNTKLKEEDPELYSKIRKDEILDLGYFDEDELETLRDIESVSPEVYKYLINLKRDDLSIKNEREFIGIKFIPDITPIYSNWI